jgi:4-hydroxyproline epimerase
MAIAVAVHVIDSHTEGEPTRVVIAGGPELGGGSLAERLHRLRTEHDHFRTGVLLEPRGSEVIVGALLLEPVDPKAASAVIFFNDAGYLGMCGHGTIGVVTTLAHQGRIGPGVHTIETPAGAVSASMQADGRVTVGNVLSRRYRAGVAVEVAGYGRVTGDIAWGGNWFFLSGDHRYPLVSSKCRELTVFASALRDALRAQGITGEAGEEIDHIELYSGPHDPANSARNFVLCPGAAFDRSPCGTGTSAKMACLHADGRLAPGEIWRQEGILGTVFEGWIAEAEGGVYPSIRGRAWITAESTLRFDADDPFASGIRF